MQFRYELLGVAAGQKQVKLLACCHCSCSQHTDRLGNCSMGHTIFGAVCGKCSCQCCHLCLRYDVMPIAFVEICFNLRSGEGVGGAQWDGEGDSYPDSYRWQCTDL